MTYISLYDFVITILLISLIVLIIFAVGLLLIDRYILIKKK